MKINLSLMLAGLLMCAVTAFAGNGDLIVDGNLGVGTTTPQSKLNVFATNNPTLTLTDGTLGVTYGGAVRGYGVAGSGGVAELGVLDNGIYTRGILVSAQATSLQFFSGGTTAANAERMRITSAGNMLIGYPIDAQGSKLQVYASNPIRGILAVLENMDTTSSTGTYLQFVQNGIADWSIGQPAGVGDFAFSFGRNPNTDGYEKLRITSAGNVGIGTASPVYTLDVNGTIRGSNVSPSDIRLKENIEPVEAALAKISNLRGVSFDWKQGEFGKNFPQGRHYGVIAQETEKVLPEVVSTAPDGIKAVAYTEIIPVLIEAIKEQQREIESLKKKVADLE